MMAYRIERHKIETTAGIGPIAIDVRGYAKASFAAIVGSTDITTGVIEIKKAWRPDDPDGISFGSAVTLDSSGAAPSEGVDCTDSPYLLIKTTTAQAGKVVEVIVYLTDSIAPV